MPATADCTCGWWLQPLGSRAVDKLGQGYFVTKQRKTRRLGLEPAHCSGGHDLGLPPGHLLAASTASDSRSADRSLCVVTCRMARR
jgi:hypothetical protein